MQRIYGKRNIAAYISLKARLFEKLIQVLILQHENEDKEEALTQQIENLKTIVASNILLSQGPNKLGLQILEKSITISIKKHFTENVIISARRLIRGYGSMRYNKYKYIKYLNIQRKYIEIYIWELKAQNYFIEIQNFSLNSFGLPSKEFIYKSTQYINELDTAGDLPSPIFNFNKFRVKAIYYEYSKEYENSTEYLKLSHK
jgi:hypothetical protein